MDMMICVREGIVFWQALFLFFYLQNKATVCLSFLIVVFWFKLLMALFFFSPHVEKNKVQPYFTLTFICVKL